MLQDSEIKSADNDEGENEYNEENEDNDGSEDKIFSVSKGHLDGMVGEVDKFMANGGYHVLYIGSVPVSMPSLCRQEP